MQNILLILSFGIGHILKRNVAKSFENLNMFIEITSICFCVCEWPGDKSFEKSQTTTFKAICIIEKSVLLTKNCINILIIKLNYK